MSRNLRRFIKLIALLTAVCLAVPPATFAVSAPPVSLPTLVLPNQKTFTIPSSLGTLDEFFPGQSAKTFILIQDAHQSFEAQRHIAALIETLVAQQGVKTVFEEGYEGPVPTDELMQEISDPLVKQRVAYYLMDQLQIGGAEYAHINREKRVVSRQLSVLSEKNVAVSFPPLRGGKDRDVDSSVSAVSSPHVFGGDLDGRSPTKDFGDAGKHGDFTLIGADKLREHFDSVAWYSKAARVQDQVDRDLSSASKELERLIPHFVSKPMRRLLKAKRAYEIQKIDFIAYLREMAGLAIAQMGGVSFSADYPGLANAVRALDSKQALAIDEVRKLAARDLWRELEQLERDLHRRFLKTEIEKALMDFYEKIHRLKRLNKIEMTAGEYERVQNTAAGLKTQELADFIAKYGKNTVVLSKAWEDNIRYALKFYQTALERDSAVQQAAETFIKNPDEQIAVLVYGGFHTGRIREILRGLGVTYAVVSPRITRADKIHEERYRALMSGPEPDLKVNTVSRLSRYLSAIELRMNGSLEVSSGVRSQILALRAVMAEIPKDVSLQQTILEADLRLKHQSAQRPRLLAMSETRPTRSQDATGTLRFEMHLTRWSGTSQDATGMLRSEMRSGQEEGIDDEDNALEPKDFDQPFIRFADEMEEMLGAKAWWRREFMDALARSHLTEPMRGHIAALLRVLEIEQATLIQDARQAGQQALSQTPGEAEAAQAKLLERLVKFRTHVLSIVVSMEGFMKAKHFYATYPFSNFLNLYLAYAMAVHKTLSSDIPVFDASHVPDTVAKMIVRTGSNSQTALQMLDINSDFKFQLKWFDDFKDSMVNLRNLYRDPELDQAVGHAYDLLLQEWSELTGEFSGIEEKPSVELRRRWFKAMDRVAALAAVSSSNAWPWHTAQGGQPKAAEVYALQVQLMAAAKVFFDAIYIGDVDVPQFFELHPDGRSMGELDEGSFDQASTAARAKGDTAVAEQLLDVVKAFNADPLFSTKDKRRLNQVTAGLTAQNCPERMEAVAEAIWEASVEAMKYAKTEALRLAALGVTSSRPPVDENGRLVREPPEKQTQRQQMQRVEDLYGVITFARMRSTLALEDHYEKRLDFNSFLRVSLRATPVQNLTAAWNHDRRLQMASALNGLRKYDLERPVLKVLLEEPLSPNTRADVLSRYAALLATHYPMEARRQAEALLRDMEAALGALGQPEGIFEEALAESLVLEMATYHLIIGGREHTEKAMAVTQALSKNRKDRVELVGIYASRQMGSLLLAEGDLVRAGEWFQRAIQHADAFVDGQKVLTAESARIPWKDYYRGLVAASAQKNQEALDFFEQAENNRGSELTGSLLFEKAILLEKAGRRPEAVAQVLTFFRVRDEYRNDGTVSNWMDHAWNFSSDESRRVFLDLTETVIRNPGFWVEEQTLRAAVELLIRENRMRSYEILALTGKWLLQDPSNAEEVTSPTGSPVRNVLGAEQLPALESILEGLHEVLPLTVREQVMAWRWKLEGRQEGTAKFLKTWLEQKSLESMGESAMQELTTRYILAGDAAKASLSGEDTETRDVDDLLKFFAQARLVHSNYDMTKVLDLVRDIYNYTSSNRVHLTALANISFYSATLIACKNLYEDLQDYSKEAAQDGRAIPELDAILERFRASFLKAIEAEFREDHNDVFKQFMQDSEQLPFWRFAFYQTLYEAALVLKSEPVQQKAFEDYIQFYKANPVVSNGFAPMMARRLGASMFMKQIEKRIREGAAESAHELMAFYAPLWAQALYAIETNGALDPVTRRTYLNSQMDSVGDLSDSAWFVMTLPESPLRPVLMHFMETMLSLDPDLMVSESTDPYQFFKLLTFSRGAMAAKRMDLFRIFTRALVDSHIDFTTQAASDLLLLQEMLLRLEYEERRVSGTSDGKTAARLEEISKLLEQKITVGSPAGARADFERLRVRRSLLWGKAADAAADLNRLAEQAHAAGETASEEAFLFDSVLAYALAGDRKRAIEMAKRASESAPALASVAMKTREDVIAERILFEPRKHRAQRVQAYILMLREAPVFSGPAVKEALRVIYFTDRSFGAPEIRRWLREQLQEPATLDQERTLLLLEWLAESGHPSWDVYYLAGLLSPLLKTKRVRGRSETLMEKIKPSLSAGDWVEILNEAFRENNDGSILQVEADLTKKFSGAAAAGFAAGFAVIEKAKKRKELSAKVITTYNVGDYAQTLKAFQDLRALNIPVTAAVAQYQTRAVQLQKALTLAQIGLWHDGLDLLEAVLEPQRDVRWKAEKTKLEVLQIQLKAVEEALEAHRCESASSGLLRAVAEYKTTWGVQPGKEQGELTQVFVKIQRSRSQLEKLLSQIEDPSWRYPDILADAALVNAISTEHTPKVFKAVLNAAVASFNAAASPRLRAEEKRKKYTDAFHRARLVYELADSYEAPAGVIAKANEIIAQSSAHIWLPQLEDDFWIISAMAKAEELRDKREREDWKGSAEQITFEFEGRDVEIEGDRLVIRGLAHEEPEPPQNKKSMDTKHRKKEPKKKIPIDMTEHIWQDDTFQIQPRPVAGVKMDAALNRSATAPSQKLESFFKVVFRDKDVVVFEIPKTREGPEAFKEKIIAQLKNGGKLIRTKNTVWTRQKNMLITMMNNLKKNLERQELDPGAVAAALPSTGNPRMDEIMGLNFDAFDKRIRQGQQTQRAGILARIARYEEEQRVTNPNFTFDEVQREALAAMLNPLIPFVLVQGPPGTGKTTVIRAALHILTEKLGVFVSSQQNHALDKVLRGMLDDLKRSGKPRRLARAGSNNDGIMDVEIAGMQTTRVGDFARLARDTGNGFSVYATANGGPQDRPLEESGLLNRVQAGIMDESTRATPEEALYLIDYLKKMQRYISVGDPYQLGAYGVSQSDVAQALHEFELAHVQSLQEEGLANRKVYDIFSRQRRKNFKKSIFERSLNLFLRPDENGEIFKATRPAFYFLDVNRRSPYDFVEQELPHFYPAPRTIKAGRMEPGVLIVDDTAGSSPEINSNGLWQGAAPSARHGEVFDKDYTANVRMNPGEADRVMHWLSVFFNEQRIPLSKVVVLTPYQGQIKLIQQTLKDIARIHNYLVRREKGDADRMRNWVTDSVKRRFRHAFFETRKTDPDFIRLPLGTQDRQAGQAWDQFWDALGRLIQSPDSDQSRKDAAELRRALGLGEIFVTPEEIQKGTLTIGVTVDSSIGEEWDGVIVSWVRSNDRNEWGFLGGDEREDVGDEGRNVGDQRKKDLSEGQRRRNVGASRIHWGQMKDGSIVGGVKVEIGDFKGFMAGSDQEMSAWARMKVKAAAINLVNRTRLGGNVPDPARVAAELERKAAVASATTAVARSEVRHDAFFASSHASDFETGRSEVRSVPLGDEEPHLLSFAAAREAAEGLHDEVRKAPANPAMPRTSLVSRGKGDLIEWTPFEFESPTGGSMFAGIKKHESQGTLHQFLGFTSPLDEQYQGLMQAFEDAFRVYGMWSHIGSQRVKKSIQLIEAYRNGSDRYLIARDRQKRVIAIVLSEGAQIYSIPLGYGDLEMRKYQGRVELWNTAPTFIDFMPPQFLIRYFPVEKVWATASLEDYGDDILQEVAQLKPTVQAREVLEVLQELEQLSRNLANHDSRVHSFNEKMKKLNLMFEKPDAAAGYVLSRAAYLAANENGLVGDNMEFVPFMIVVVRELLLRAMRARSPSWHPESYEPRWSVAKRQPYFAWLDDVDGNLTVPGTHEVPEDIIDEYVEDLRQGLLKGLATGRMEQLPAGFVLENADDVQSVVSRIQVKLLAEGQPEAIQHLYIFPENASYVYHFEWDARTDEYVRTEEDLVQRYLSGIVLPEPQVLRKLYEDWLNYLRGQGYEGEPFVNAEIKRYGFGGKFRDASEHQRLGVLSLSFQAQHPQYAAFGVTYTDTGMDFQLKGISKALALRYIRDTFRLEDAQIAAFGDRGGLHGNDRDLLNRKGGFSTEDFDETNQDVVPLSQVLKEATPLDRRLRARRELKFWTRSEQRQVGRTLAGAGLWKPARSEQRSAADAARQQVSSQTNVAMRLQAGRMLQNVISGGGVYADSNRNQQQDRSTRKLSNPEGLGTWNFHSLLIKKPAKNEAESKTIRLSLIQTLKSVKNRLASAAAKIIENKFSSTRWIKSRRAAVSIGLAGFMSYRLQGVLNLVNKNIVLLQYLALWFSPRIDRLSFTNARSEVRTERDAQQAEAMEDIARELTVQFQLNPDSQELLLQLLTNRPGGEELAYPLAAIKHLGKSAIKYGVRHYAFQKWYQWFPEIARKWGLYPYEPNFILPGTYQSYKTAARGLRFKNFFSAEDISLIILGLLIREGGLKRIQEVIMPAQEQIARDLNMDAVSELQQSSRRNLQDFETELRKIKWLIQDFVAPGTNVDRLLQEVIVGNNHLTIGVNQTYEWLGDAVLDVIMVRFFQKPFSFTPRRRSSGTPAHEKFVSLTQNVHLKVMMDAALKDPKVKKKGYQNAADLLEGLIGAVFSTYESDPDLGLQKAAGFLTRMVRISLKVHGDSHPDRSTFERFTTHAFFYEPLRSDFETGRSEVRTAREETSEPMLTAEQKRKIIVQKIRAFNQMLHAEQVPAMDPLFVDKPQAEEDQDEVDIFAEKKDKTTGGDIRAMALYYALRRAVMGEPKGDEKKDAWEKFIPPLLEIATIYPELDPPVALSDLSLKMSSHPEINQVRIRLIKRLRMASMGEEQHESRGSRLHPVLISLMMIALNMGVPEARVEVIRTLPELRGISRLERNAYLHILPAMYQDQRTGIPLKEAILEAIGRYGARYEDLRPFLIEKMNIIYSIEEENPRLQTAALKALAQMGDFSKISELIYQRDPNLNRDLILDFIQSLGSVKTAMAFDFLDSLVGYLDADHQFMREVFVALRRQGTAAAYHLLQQKAFNADQRLRNAALANLAPLAARQAAAIAAAHLGTIPEADDRLQDESLVGEDLIAMLDYLRLKQRVATSESQSEPPVILNVLTQLQKFKDYKLAFSAAPDLFTLLFAYQEHPVEAIHEMAERVARQVTEWIDSASGKTLVTAAIAIGYLSNRTERDLSPDQAELAVDALNTLADFEDSLALLKVSPEVICTLAIYHDHPIESVRVAAQRALQRVVDDIRRDTEPAELSVDEVYRNRIFAEFKALKAGDVDAGRVIQDFQRILISMIPIDGTILSPADEEKLRIWIPEIAAQLRDAQIAGYFLNKGDFSVQILPRLIELEPAAFNDARFLRNLVRLARAAAAPDFDGDKGHYASGYVIQTMAEAAEQQGLVFPQKIYTQLKGQENAIVKNFVHGVLKEWPAADPDRVGRLLEKIGTAPLRFDQQLQWVKWIGGIGTLIYAVIALYVLAPVYPSYFLLVFAEGWLIVGLTLWVGQYRGEYLKQMSLMAGFMAGFHWFFHHFLLEQAPGLMHVPPLEWGELLKSIAIRSISVFASVWGAEKIEHWLNKSSPVETNAARFQRYFQWSLAIGVASGYYILDVALPFFKMAVHDTWIPGLELRTSTAFLRSALDLGLASWGMHTWMMLVLGGVFGEGQNILRDFKKLYNPGLFFRTETGKKYLLFAPMSFVIWVVPLFLMWYQFDEVTTLMQISMVLVGTFWGLALALVVGGKSILPNLEPIRKQPRFKNIKITYAIPKPEEPFEFGDIIQLTGDPRIADKAARQIVSRFPDYERATSALVDNSIYLKRASVRSEMRTTKPADVFLKELDELKNGENLFTDHNISAGNDKSFRDFKIVARYYPGFKLVVGENETFGMESWAENQGGILRIEILVDSQGNKLERAAYLLGNLTKGSPQTLAQTHMKTFPEWAHAHHMKELHDSIKKHLSDIAVWNREVLELSSLSVLALRLNGALVALREKTKKPNDLQAVIAKIEELGKVIADIKSALAPSALAPYSATVLQQRLAKILWSLPKESQPLPEIYSSDYLTKSNLLGRLTHKAGFDHFELDIGPAEKPGLILKATKEPKVTMQLEIPANVPGPVFSSKPFWMSVSGVGLVSLGAAAGYLLWTAPVALLGLSLAGVFLLWAYKKFGHWQIPANPVLDEAVRRIKTHELLQAKLTVLEERLPKRITLTIQRSQNLKAKHPNNIAAIEVNLLDQSGPNRKGSYAVEIFSMDAEKNRKEIGFFYADSSPDFQTIVQTKIWQLKIKDPSLTVGQVLQGWNQSLMPAPPGLLSPDVLLRHKKFFIPGMTGSLGIPLSQRLAQIEGVSVVGATRSAAKLRELSAILNSNVRLEEADIFNYAYLQKSIEAADVIYPFSAWARIGSRPTDAEIFASNVALIALITKLAQESGKRLVFPSSGAVHLLEESHSEVSTEDVLNLHPEVDAYVALAVGEFSSFSLKKDNFDLAKAVEFSTRFLRDHPVPSQVHDMYALSKLIAEKIAAQYKNAVVLRIGSVYGPWDRTERIFPTLLRELSDSSKQNQPYEVSNKRIFLVYEKTVTDAFLAAASIPVTENNQIINVVGHESIRLPALAELIQKELAQHGRNADRPILIQSSPAATVVRPPFILSYDRAQQYLQLPPQILLEEGVKRTVTQFLKNNTRSEVRTTAIGERGVGKSTTNRFRNLDKHRMGGAKANFRQPLGLVGAIKKAETISRAHSFGAEGIETIRSLLREADLHQDREVAQRMSAELTQFAKGTKTITRHAVRQYWYRLQQKLASANAIQEGELYTKVINAFGWTEKENTEPIRLYSEKDLLRQMRARKKEGVPALVQLLDGQFNFNTATLQERPLSLKTGLRLKENTLTRATFERATQKLKEAVLEEEKFAQERTRAALRKKLAGKTSRLAASNAKKAIAKETQSLWLMIDKTLWNALVSAAAAKKAAGRRVSSSRNTITRNASRSEVRKTTTKSQVDFSHSAQAPTAALLDLNVLETFSRSEIRELVIEMKQRSEVRFVIFNAHSRHSALLGLRQLFRGFQNVSWTQNGGEEAYKALGFRLNGGRVVAFTRASDASASGFSGPAQKKIHMFLLLRRPGTLATALRYDPNALGIRWAIRRQNGLYVISESLTRLATNYLNQFVVAISA